MRARRVWHAACYFIRHECRTSDPSIRPPQCEHLHAGQFSSRRRRGRSRQGDRGRRDLCRRFARCRGDERSRRVERWRRQIGTKVCSRQDLGRRTIRRRRAGGRQQPAAHTGTRAADCCRHGCGATGGLGRECPFGGGRHREDSGRFGKRCVRGCKSADGTIRGARRGPCGGACRTTPRCRVIDCNARSRGRESWRLEAGRGARQRHRASAYEWDRHDCRRRSDRRDGPCSAARRDIACAVDQPERSAANRIGRGTGVGTGIGIGIGTGIGLTTGVGTGIGLCTGIGLTTGISLGTGSSAATTTGRGDRSGHFDGWQ
jgi:hypothetical protein